MKEESISRLRALITLTLAAPALAIIGSACGWITWRYYTEAGWPAATRDIALLLVLGHGMHLTFLGRESWPRWCLQAAATAVLLSLRVHGQLGVLRGAGAFALLFTIMSSPWILRRLKHVKERRAAGAGGAR